QFKAHRLFVILHLNAKIWIRSSERLWRFDLPGQLEGLGGRQQDSCGPRSVLDWRERVKMPTVFDFRRHFGCQRRAGWRRADNFDGPGNWVQTLFLRAARRRRDYEEDRGQQDQK